MQELTKYILLFFFYSIAGWLVESTYCSIGEGKLVNRGFLTGPLCPIYGSGALTMIIFLYNPFFDKPLYIFALGMILCDILEYTTSFMMEKLFSARWWDYTYEFMNIKGRICLKHSLYWGMASIAFVKLIHPGVDYLYDSIDTKFLPYILAVVLVIFALDVLNATRKAMDIRKLLKKLDTLIEKVSDNFSTVKTTVGDSYANIQNTVQKQSDKIHEVSTELNDQVQDFIKQFELRTKKKDEKDKNKLYNRLFGSNHKFEVRMRKRVEKLKDLRDDIKSNIFEQNEMQ